MASKDAARNKYDNCGEKPSDSLNPHGKTEALDSAPPVGGKGVLSSATPQPIGAELLFAEPAASVTRSSRSSRHTGSTAVARKLAAEAELRRRQLEREEHLLQERERERQEREHERREFERKQREVEEMELQAEFAAFDSAKSKGSMHSNLSRTRSWVRSVRATHTNPAPEPAAAQDTGVACTAAHLGDNKAIKPLFAQDIGAQQIAAHLGDNTAIDPLTRFDTCQKTSSVAVEQLATAVASLAASKHSSLPLFTGSYKEWLPFKFSYDRTYQMFSPAQNVSRMADALRGHAREAVATLLFSNADPAEVVATLERTFARPEVIVASEVSVLRSAPKVASPYQLNVFANQVRNCVANLKALQQAEYLHSPELLKNVISKLSELTKARFADFAADFNDTSVSKLEILSSFLLREAERQLKFCYVPDFNVVSSVVARPSPALGKREHVNATTSNEQNTPNCIFCKQAHTINLCNDFKRLSIDERWRWVREARVCFKCLKGNSHRWNRCKAKRCGKDGCSRGHHSLLHGATEANSFKSTTPQPIATTYTPTTLQAERACTSASEHDSEPLQVKIMNLPCNLSSQDRPRSRALLRVLPVVLRGPSGEFETYALLDDGSSASLIDSEVAKRIGAQDEYRQSIRIDGVGGMCRETNVGYTKFYIRGRGLSDEYLVENARSIHGLSLRAQNVPREELSKYSHLADLADILALDNATPMVLIGVGDWHLSISRDIRKGKRSEPVATRTVLGWVLHGHMSSKTEPVEFVNHLTDTECDSIEALLREQYRLDAIGISKVPPKNNEEDQRAIDIIESTVRRLPTGHFEVGLPWRQNNLLNIPSSYAQALARFKSLEKQMSKDPTFAAAYQTFINGILTKGYAEECAADTYYSKETTNTPTNTIRWYLPHFGVLHPQKKKLRAVHDAAAETKGVSLNSLLLTGPDLLQPLLGILFRFREGKVAITGDIREMFPQIKIKESDRDAQRFLWRDTTTSSIKEYRMSSMIFGAVSSPFMALYLKNKNAHQYQALFPEAAHDIMYNHYMDDYIASYDSVEQTAKIASDVLNIHAACCSEMRSWLTNDLQALKFIPKELWANPGFEAVLPTDVSALGIRWNPAQDTLGFRIGDSVSNASNKLTKRIILSRIMKVYDPLGLLTPIVIKGRILIQNLWREGLGWDDELSPHYVEAWREWSQELSLLTDLQIPRRYLLSNLPPKDTQLHVFANASELAYACVVYWRFDFGDGDVRLSLVGAKARVTPLKPCTIPRLELQAALIGARFASTIKDSHRLKPSSVVYWTDSSTVLKWLRGDARRYKPFVAHRVGEILELTHKTEWRWLPSAENIADDATRMNGLQPRWFEGPSFLRSPFNEWPCEPTNVVDTPPPEIKEVVAVFEESSSVPPVPDSARFSSWLRLLRATATVILAVRKFRSFLCNLPNTNSKLCSIVASDIVLAEKLLIVKSQFDSFAEEIHALRESRPLPKSSRLSSLSLKLQDGLLVLDSRIKTLPVDEETVTTRIVLDDRHRITRLLIYHHHIRAGHGFNELIFNELRQRLWILRGRRAIKNVAAECLICKRRKKLPPQLPFGDLPIERLQHHLRPFSNIGLDYFGPVEVTVGRHHEKRWVSLFSCLVTRALHLEVVFSLSADSAIMCLRRFIARRGCPLKIISDNGTSFVGASRELKSLFDQRVQDYAANNKIEWTFLPPASPFMAGATERMVRSVKSALKATLQQRAPKDEVLHTFLLEAEAICNSRPLTYVVTSDDAPQAITPFNFIIGTSSNSQWLVGELNDSDLSRRIHWKQVFRLADHFWARWLKEYLPTLVKRPSCTAPTPGLHEGDVVVVADPALPRGVWPLGRIIKTYPGPDRIVRVADVNTRGGILKRPSRKLVPLVAADQAVATQ